MPNMLDDGLLDQAFVVRTYANNPTNSDFALQNLVATAISNAAGQGLGTVTVNVNAYANSLVQLLVQRLVNMGYTATMGTNTITVAW